MKKKEERFKDAPDMLQAIAQVSVAGPGVHLSSASLDDDRCLFACVREYARCVFTINSPPFRTGFAGAIFFYGNVGLKEDACI